MSLLILGFIGLAIFLYSRHKFKQHLPLPPGPPADPIIGHLRHIPPENQHLLFYKWGKTYGDVIHLHIPGRSFIILNSVEAAVDLLDKRSSNYSDRPKFIIFELMALTEYTMSFLPYGKRFQRHHRMLHHYFAENKCTAYRPIQLRESRILLQRLLTDDNNRETLIQRFSVAIIMKVAFGHQITSEDDPCLKIAEDAGRVISNAGPPGGTVLEFLPFLRYFPSWFPGTYYANYARENRDTILKLFDYPLEQVQREMAEGKAKPSFLSHQLEALHREGANYPNTIDDIKGATGIIYFAGAETTATTLSTFFLAITLYPECQRRAQKEIDAVVGLNRLPDFGDYESLPYVDCIVHETLRWNNAAPLGLPHRSMKDDVYRGMFIPKGSTIIANTRAMTLDDKVYQNPHTYNPSRFLPTPHGNGEPYPSGPFGYGRRTCPGRHLAHASLWIAIASILATFEISKVIGEDGVEITPKVAFSGSVTSHPLPYQCHIRPRSEAAKRLIVQAETSDGY